MASPKTVAGELVLRCLNASTTAHILHLQTGSFAVHMALGEFYEGIVELTDSFAEAYQGVYGRIDSYPTIPSYSNSKDYKNGLALLAELRKWIIDNRYSICREEKEAAHSEGEEYAEDTELQNLVDEIVALIDRTAYKVRFLK